MKRRLPPLNPLRSFEAAVRNRSFSAAADELSLTHGAVSKAVKGLEEYLEVSLLERLPRGVEPTPLGRELAFLLQRFLDELSGFVEDTRSPRSPGRIKVSAVPSLGVNWLLPRLRAFVTDHPEIELDISLTAQLADFRRNDIDVGIRYGLGPWEGLEAIRLMGAPLVPVAAADLVAGLSLPVRAEALRRRSDLLHYVSDHDWQLWFRGLGCELPEQLGGIVLDNMTSVVQAVREGAGVALVPEPLIRGDLEAGRLRVLSEAKVAEDRAYYLVAPASRLKRPEVTAFIDWARKAARHPQPA